jgi:hypothetical protein
MLRGAFCLLLVLSGCSSTAVRCDAHLVPINKPAEKVGNLAPITGSMP